MTRNLMALRGAAICGLTLQEVQALKNRNAKRTHLSATKTFETTDGARRRKKAERQAKRKGRK